MALFDLGFQSSRKPDKREEALTPIEKPTFMQQLTGTGEFMRELGTQKGKLAKEYLSQRREYHSSRRLREKEYKKAQEKRREVFWGRKAGRWDLVDRDLTPAELADRDLKKWAEKYNEMEEQAKLDFIESERKGEKELKKSYHERLKQTSADLRSRTRLPSQSPGGGLKHESPRSRILGA